MSKADHTCLILSASPNPGGFGYTPEEVYEILLVPALEGFGFEIPEDGPSTPAQVTDRLVGQLRDADLCLIDITEVSPAVVFAWGYRQGSGKPVILVREHKSSASVEFAAQGSVEYDLSDARAALTSKRAIQDVLRSIPTQEFESSSQVTLRQVMETLKGIERIVQKWPAGGGLRSASQDSRGGSTDLALDPQVVLRRAIASQDVQTIIALVPRLANFGVSDALVTAAGIAAMEGDANGLDVLLNILRNDGASVAEISLLNAIAATVQTFIRSRRTQEGIETLTPILLELATRSDLSARGQASIYNQLQMLNFSADSVEAYEEALRLGLLAMKTFPEELAFMYNVSMTYEKLGRIDEARDLVETYLAIGTDDVDHLFHAVTLYQDHGPHDKADELLERLGRIDPYYADTARRRARQIAAQRSGSSSQSS